MQTYYRCEEGYEEDAAKLSKANVAAYFKTFGTRLGCKLFETTMPRGVLGLIRGSAVMLRWRRSIT